MHINLVALWTNDPCCSMGIMRTYVPSAAALLQPMQMERSNAHIDSSSAAVRSKLTAVRVVTSHKTHSRAL